MKRIEYLCGGALLTVECESNIEFCAWMRDLLTSYWVSYIVVSEVPSE